MTITGHPGALARAPSRAIRHNPRRRIDRVAASPDRLALWAFLLGVVLMLAAAGSGLH